MLKKQLVFDIINTEGTYEKIEKYNAYKKLLGNCKIILFDEEKSNLGSSYGDVVIGKCGIYGLGDYTKTWIIDPMHDSDVSFVCIGKTLDFDLNILTYLNKVLRGKNFGEGIVKQDLVDFFNYIKKNMYQTGIASAILERSAKRIDEAVVRDVLASYAKYEEAECIDIEGINFTAEERLEKIYHGFMQLKDIAEKERVYDIVCCCVLKAYLIKNYDKNLSVEEKINNFILFCLRELNCYLEKEIILISSYLSDAHETQNTFKKLNKTKNVVENIRNVAWDIYHVRFLEQLICIDNKRKWNTILPYFATADQDVVQAMRYNPLKAYVIVDGTGIAFHSITLEDICSDVRILEEAETGKAERAEKIVHTDFSVIRMQLEQEIRRKTANILL